MHQITEKDMLDMLVEKKGTKAVIVVNAFVLDTVYCVEELELETIQEKRGDVIRLFCNSEQKDYCYNHGIYIELGAINKITFAANTIYIYLREQLIKINF